VFASITKLLPVALAHVSYPFNLNLTSCPFNPGARRWCWCSCWCRCWWGLLDTVRHVIDTHL